MTYSRPYKNVGSNNKPWFDSDCFKAKKEIEINLKKCKKNHFNMCNNIFFFN